MDEFYQEHGKDILTEAYSLLPQLRAIYNEHGSDALIESINQTINAVWEHFNIKDKISCKNCSFCCHNNIYVTQLEFQYLQKRITELGIKGNQERFVLQNSLPQENLTFMQRACPFLMDENAEGNRLCSIYEIRPIVCRVHNSTLDPKFCNLVEYPKYTIRDIRTVATEAIPMALALLEKELGLQNGIEPQLKLMHQILT